MPSGHISCSTTAGDGSWIGFALACVDDGCPSPCSERVKHSGQPHHPLTDSLTSHIRSYEARDLCLPLQSFLGRNLPSVHVPMARAALFCTIVAVSLFPAPTLAAACEPRRCGNVTVSYPFGIVSGADENGCAQLGFQVHCDRGDTPYLGYYEFDVGLQILDIFYANASLLVSDVHKLGDFSAAGCHVPTANTASKIAAPFFISALNRNLFFYNCAEEPARAVRERAGLVGTVCRNKTFVRAGGRYVDEPRDYAVEGCSDTAVTVRGPSYGELNASDYHELISDGFLLTWQPRSSGE
uniref:Uncharacterized protein n=1 Tax=Avena sativa TaxID=4498 RepID=A0ACD5VIA0_AVESA